MSTPSVNDIADASITEFAKQRTGDVIDILTDYRLPNELRNRRAAEHFPSLINVDTSLTFSSGAAALPSGYQTALSVKVNTVTPAVTKRFCRLLFDASEFARWDSSNFVYTPDQERPIAYAGDQIYIKPSTLTAGFIDFVETHPTISGSQGTVFSPLGDNILIDLILADYYAFIEEADLMNLHLKSAEVHRGNK